eukprot:PhF_6_TR15962/c3_g1_i5/m.24898
MSCPDPEYATAVREIAGLSDEMQDQCDLILRDTLRRHINQVIFQLGSLGSDEVNTLAPRLSSLNAAVTSPDVWNRVLEIRVEDVFIKGEKPCDIYGVDKDNVVSEDAKTGCVVLQCHHRGDMDRIKKLVSSRTNAKVTEEGVCVEWNKCRTQVKHLWESSRDKMNKAIADKCLPWEMTTAKAQHAVYRQLYAIISKESIADSEYVIGTHFREIISTCETQLLGILSVRGSPKDTIASACVDVVTVMKQLMGVHQHLDDASIGRENCEPLRRRIEIELNKAVLHVIENVNASVAAGDYDIADNCCQALRDLVLFIRQTVVGSNTSFDKLRKDVEQAITDVKVAESTYIIKIVKEYMTTESVHVESFFKAFPALSKYGRAEVLLKFRGVADALSKIQAGESDTCLVSRLGRVQSFADQISTLLSGESSRPESVLQQALSEALAMLNKTLDSQRHVVSSTKEAILRAIKERLEDMNIDRTTIEYIQQFNVIRSALSQSEIQEVKKWKHDFVANVSTLIATCGRHLEAMTEGYNADILVKVFLQLKQLKKEDMVTFKHSDDIGLTHLVPERMQRGADKLKEQMRVINKLMDDRDYTSVVKMVEYVQKLHNNGLKNVINIPEVPNLKSVVIGYATTSEHEWTQGNLKAFDQAASRLSAIVQAFEQSPVCAGFYKEIKGLHDNLESFVKRTFQASINDALVNPADIQKLACIIFEVRRKAIHAPCLIQLVITVIDNILREVQVKTSNMHIAKLGAAIELDTLLGSDVLKEHSKFFGNAAGGVWRKATGLKPSDCMKGMGYFPDLDPQGRSSLLLSLEEYEKLVDDYKTKYFLRGTAGNVIQLEIQQELHHRATMYKSDSTPHNLKSLVLHTAAAYMLFASADMFRAKVEDGDADAESVIIRPHITQVATVLRLLSCEENTKSVSWYGRVLNTFGVAKAPSEQAFQNHMVQILTGQGKSITLGVLSVVLALLDLHVDVVCYSDYLTQRDYAALSPFFEYVGVKGAIRYFTFEQLCEARVDGIRDLAHHLISTGKPAPQSVTKTVTSTKRVLLIDEVDVFFSKRFYGRTYNPCVTLKHPTINALIQAVFANRGKGAYNVLTSPEYVAVKTQFPHIEELLKHSAEAMVKNASDFGTPAYKYEPSQKRIGYKRDELFDTNIVYPNKTVFAYLQLVADNTITMAEAEQQLGIDLTFGQFSYANIPLREYCGILGVTGTLQTQKTDLIPAKMILTKEEREIMESDYKIKRMTFACSVYGSPTLDFTFNQDVKFHDDEASWSAAVEIAATRASNDKGACLVFFKNRAQLKKFCDSQPNMATVLQLTEDTPADRRQGIINAATHPNKITLLTRTFGRGIDFACRPNVLVTVIQTFFSSSLSEQVQIKGRTARQKEPGKYVMHLCKPHLVDKFKVVLGDLETAVNSATQEQYLESKRDAKMALKTKDRQARKITANALDLVAWEVVETLLGPGDASHQLATLRKACSRLWTAPSLFVVMLDVSGSMSGARWTMLCQAYNTFLTELRTKRDPSQQSSTIISVIFFSETAREHTCTKLADAPALPTTCPGGGTDFIQAFTKGEEVLIRKEYDGYDRTLLFLTDGEAASPVTTIEKMLQRCAKDLSSFYCINFSGTTAPSVLQEVVRTFQTYKVTSSLSNPGNAIQLTEVFKQAAQDVPMHR